MATNVELAREGFGAALAGDLDTVRAFLDPDVRWHGGEPDAEDACHNREQALSVIEQASAQGSIGELVAVVAVVGDRVVVILRPAGADRTVANLATFRDGKVVEMVHYIDPGEALGAAGF